MKLDPITIYMYDTGLHVKELAEKIGVSRSTLTNWKNGVSQPPIMRVRDIAEILGINEYELYLFFTRGAQEYNVKREGGDIEEAESAVEFS